MITRNTLLAAAASAIFLVTSSGCIDALERQASNATVHATANAAMNEITVWP
jgi:hypothetical protein